MQNPKYKSRTAKLDRVISSRSRNLSSKTQKKKKDASLTVRSSHRLANQNHTNPKPRKSPAAKGHPRKSEEVKTKQEENVAEKQ